MRRPASQSLERKLPLLMTAVLLAVLVASLVLTYRTLSRGAEEAARGRFAQTTAQIASTAEAQMRRRGGMLVDGARDPSIRAALGTRDTTVRESARRALMRLVSPADSGLPLELWNAQGERVLSASPAADSLRAPMPDSIRAELLRAPPDRALGDSARVSSLYSVGDRIAFWVVAPLRRGQTEEGYVAQMLRVSSARDASRTLREIMGQPVTVFLRNRRGDAWALAPGAPTTTIPTQRDSVNGALTYVRGRERMMATEAAVAGTPWLFVLEAPIESVRSQPRETVMTLALVSLALMAVGAAISWFISRSITRPLGGLTVAAEAIAKGEYARRVRVTGRDEIGRLADSFNQMASQIDASRRELEERVDDARRAREEAEAANRAKSDFLAVMSHELRTPLNAISGYAQLLEMGIHGPVTEAQRDALLRINRSQAHLLSLINDVLNFAKIDAGQVDFNVTDVSVDEVMAELEAIIATQVQAKQQRLEMQDPDAELGVRADRDKLRQILLNLVSNAVKFTPEGGLIVVESARVGDIVELRVRDTGIGIPEHRLEVIFEPFVQSGRALSRTHEGVGLGLAISRDLARAMGGNITVESEVGRGSTFTVTLPFAPVSSMQVQASPRMERRATPG